MTARANQHFVPQFYFRLFAGGARQIHLLHKKSERIILNAPIKGQCARHNFYGSDEIEKSLSLLEGQQSAVLHHVREMAWLEREPVLEPNHVARVWEAIVLQRARTDLQVVKSTPASEALFLTMFTHYLKNAPGIEDREVLLAHIERGDIQIKQDPRQVLAIAMKAALENVLLISDLDFHVLRNQTDFPFLFGDSPVVFCNTYYRNVTHRGVLGMQTPGLQIFYPLNSKTMLMLIDDQVYGGRYREPLFVDIDQRCDVSQLNALQLHHSLHTAYFARAHDQQYVLDLWNAHKAAIVLPKESLHNRSGWLVDGKPVDEHLYQSFEPHLNFRLALSFIECTPIHPSQFVFRRRSPELFEEHTNKIRRRLSG